MRARPLCSRPWALSKAARICTLPVERSTTPLTLSTRPVVPYMVPSTSCSFTSGIFMMAESMLPLSRVISSRRASFTLK